MESETRIIPVKLPNDEVIKIEITPASSGEQDVAFTGIPSFEEITDTIEGIVSVIAGVLKKVKPDKAAVEFGVDISVESGKLTTLIAKGSSTANMKLTLEWERSK